MKSQISVYVRNSEDCPSCYYRIIQYLNNLEYNHVVNNLLNNKEYRLNLDIDNQFFKKILQLYLYVKIVIRLLSFLIKDLIRRPKIIIIQRSLIPKYMPLTIYFILKMVLRSKTLFWDFDDNIFLNKEISKLEAKILMHKSKIIVLTNNFLKKQIPEKFQRKVHLVPTTDGYRSDNFSLTSILNERKKTFQRTFKLIWVGTSSNLVYIESIINNIEKFAIARNKLNNLNKTVLTIVCNKPINYKSKYLIIKNVNWSRKNAYLEMIKAHIGIMPLIENNYTLGKGAFKLIQYISLGLPVLASNIGFNKEVIESNFGYLVKKNGDWLKHLITISSDIEKWESMSLIAYDSWESKFSFDDNLMFWKERIQEYL